MKKSAWFSIPIFLCAYNLLGCIGSVNGEIKSDVQSAKFDRKGDLVAQASHDHYGYYGYGPPDFYGYGGKGYGHRDGGHHVGGYHDPYKFLFPLAGVALLGAAALFVTNPVLLQLGVVSGKRRRRRRNAASDGILSSRLQDFEALEAFISQLPTNQLEKQEKKLFANFLECSGSSSFTNKCLERLTCDVQHPYSNVTFLERQVLDIVTEGLMNNEFISKGLKQRLTRAGKLGSSGGNCEKYLCADA